MTTGDDVRIEIVEDNPAPASLPSAMTSGGAPRSPKGRAQKVTFDAPVTEKERERNGFKCVHCGIVFDGRSLPSFRSPQTLRLDCRAHDAERALARARRRHGHRSAHEALLVHAVRRR